MKNKFSSLPKEVNKAFLGGACTSNWRDKITPILDENEVRYFNPVVSDWTPESRKIEEYEKDNECNIHFYYFDNSMKGVYSVAELVKSCYDQVSEYYCEDCEEYHKSTNVDIVIAALNTEGMDSHQIASYRATFDLCNSVTSEYGFIKLIEDNESKLLRKVAECLSDSSEVDYNIYRSEFDIDEIDKLLKDSSDEDEDIDF